jgi:hypothetical protein
VTKDQKVFVIVWGETKDYSVTFCPNLEIVTQGLLGKQGSSQNQGSKSGVLVGD